MPAPTDLTSDINQRIALAKNWRWVEEAKVPGTTYCAHWEDSSGQWKESPDFVGTLEGMSGMLRELGPEWAWGWDGTEYVCYRGENCGPGEFFVSPIDHPGDCVGEAYISVKEAADASSE